MLLIKIGKPQMHCNMLSGEYRPFKDPLLGYIIGVDTKGEGKEKYVADKCDIV